MRTRFVLLLFLSSLFVSSPVLPALTKEPKATATSFSPTFSPILAQRENCLDYDRNVKPSAQKKTVDLKQFGIQIKIPKNFRTMLRNNGEVWILNPVDYDLIACTARGGFGGRGLYHPYIRRIPNPNNLPLRRLVTQRERAKKFKVGKWYRSSMKPYRFSGLDGVLVESGVRSLRPSYFMKIPKIGQVVEIGIGCDCEFDNTQIFEVLKNISLL